MMLMTGPWTRCAWGRAARACAGLLIAIGLFLSAIAPVPAQVSAETVNRGLVEIVTGSVESTSARVAQDMATALDDGSTRRVLPVIGKGTFQNLIDLRSLRGVDLAIVQSDVLDYGKTQTIVPGIAGSFTYLTRLYTEEFHLLAGASINTVDDLAGKTVGFGSGGDGSALTGQRIFELLKIKIEATPVGETSALDQLRAGQIAAYGYVGGKPASVFSTLRGDSGLHFLAVPLTPPMLARYVPARLGAEDYPGLVKAQEPVETVAVTAVMLVSKLTAGSQRYRNVANFVDAFFTQIAKLQEIGHPKWREVNLSAELPGFHRFPPADAWLQRNGAPSSGLSEDQMRDIFVKFLDERTKATGQTMSGPQKEELFDQFRRWQNAQPR
jgi:TRAP transporter TAXI family solute receptor